MAWKATLDLKDLWQAYEMDDAMTVQKIAEITAGRLREQFPDDPEVEDIAFQFECVEDVREYDAVMVDLYDWADVARVWVATTF